MERFRIFLNMCTWRTLEALCVYAIRFVVGLHGTQKFHPIVKYEHDQISSGARACLVVIATSINDLKNNLDDSYETNRKSHKSSYDFLLP